MANNTVTTIDNALLEYYSAGRLVKLAYENHPFFAMVNKRKDFFGQDIPIVPWYARGQGRSRVFATAKTNATADAVAKFRLTRAKDYGVTFIDMEALLATENDAGSFLQLGVDAVEGIQETVANNLAMSLYRNHGGARGKIAAGGVAATTLTLENPADVVNFEVGMMLKHASTDGTSGALEAEAAIQITKVDRQAGILTFASTTGFDAGNYLFVEGDFGVALRGLASWLPTSVSGSDSFLGQNRSTDSRLSGIYVDAVTAGYDHVEAIEYADALCVREGGRPDTILCNPLDLRVIRTSLGSQLEYTTADTDLASVSFKAIQVSSSGNGNMKVISDPDCPIGTIFGLEMKSWTFFSLGDAPRGLESHKFKFITSESEDSVQVRVGYYGNLACYAPSHNFRIKVGVTSA
jgi:hypothetical protein